MAVGAKMTTSGTSTARSGSSFVAVLGNLSGGGFLQVYDIFSFRVLGNWMTSNCRKTCGECKCKCCSYQVSFSNLNYI